jgi:methionyl-tRNA formyltransferase
MKTHPRIIFYGTPEFAVASLRSLVESGFPVVGVVTAPDRPAGRGLRMHFSPVKEFALRHDLRLLQPVNLKDPGFHEQLRALEPDLQVVVAFRMLPREVWSLPASGTFNLHASLLPRYRGAAPINWVLINGEQETGVTTFFINEAIDQGNILFHEATAVDPEETAGELHDRLMELGSRLVVKTVMAIGSGPVKDSPQSELLESFSEKLPEAPKIQKEDCRIRWDQDALTVFNRIRGMSPYPGAFAEMNTADGSIFFLKIFRAGYEIQSHSLVPGTVVCDGKTYLRVAVRNGFIIPVEVQTAGRKSMDLLAFLRGYGRHFV